jgi:hypothetical protein
MRLIGIRRFLADHTSQARQATARIGDLAAAVAAVMESTGRPSAPLPVSEEKDA